MTRAWPASRFAHSGVHSRLLSLHIQAAHMPLFSAGSPFVGTHSVRMYDPGSPPEINGQGGNPVSDDKPSRAEQHLINEARKRQARQPPPQAALI